MDLNYKGRVVPRFNDVTNAVEYNVEKYINIDEVM